MNSEKKPRILIVDDDRDFVAATREVLEAGGYEVVEAYDGAQGLERARQTQPDLMLLDVMMATETEGIELSRKFRETPGLERIPVILLTGIRKAMKLPFGLAPDEAWLPVKAVLEKPVPPPLLLREVAKHLGASS